MDSGDADLQLETQLSALAESCAKYSQIIASARTAARAPAENERKDNCLAALIDVSKLIRAHTTKIGIAFKPPISRDAAVKCIEDLAKTTPNLAAIFLGMREEIDGSLVVREFESHVKDMYATVKAYVEQLKEAVRSEDDLKTGKRRPTSHNVSNGGTLVMVGEVWQMCDALENSANKGSTGILQEKIQEFEQIVQDGLEDLEAWIEGDGDGLDLSFGDEDSDSDDDNDKSDGERDEALITEGKLWLSRLKKLGLLLKTTRTQRCRTLSSQEHDSLYTQLRELSAAIDDLIAVFLENDNGALSKQTTLVNDIVREILSQVRAGATDKFTALTGAFEKSYFAS